LFEHVGGLRREEAACGWPTDRGKIGQIVQYGSLVAPAIQGRCSAAANAELQSLDQRR
jgi:hypothetical protein